MTNETKMRATDIILKLKVIDDKLPKTVFGNIDQRLFKGDNKLHVILDPQFMFYHFKYDQGILPEPFRQRFTSLQKALDFAKDYYLKRNIEIEQVID